MGINRHYDSADGHNQSTDGGWHTKGDGSQKNGDDVVTGRPPDILHHLALGSPAQSDYFHHIQAITLYQNQPGPTLLAVAPDVAHPVWRGTAIGVYRLWCDMGFALFGILAGLLADVFNLSVAIASIRVLTFLSGLIVLTVMRETVPSYQIPRHASS